MHRGNNNLPRLCQPRPPAIPAAVSQLKKYDPTDPNRRKLERDLEVEGGGAGQYSVDLNSTHTHAHVHASCWLMGANRL